jgi:hypothetical protein
MRRALILAAALAGLAALPAAAPAAAPPQPPPICLWTHYGMVCTYDIVPLVHRIEADPVGFVCGQPEFTCGRAQS